ncbi:hypothetical protein C0993_011803, partial [Termitomyces sp. T159_Od127]
MRTLSLCQGLWKNELSHDACEAIVSLITQSCPNIVTLDVGYSVFFKSLSEKYLLDLVQKLSKLENIFGPRGSAPIETICHLGSLPLKAVELCQDYETDVTAFATANDLFRSAESLTLHVRGWDHAISIFSAMSCSFEKLDIPGTRLPLS